MEVSLTNKSHFSSLNALKLAKEYVGELKDSELVRKFKVKNEDGELVISHGDAIGAIIMGTKLGLDPITSLSIGNDLKGYKIYALDKGVSMGLSPLEAIKLIHAIPNSKGEISLYTGIDLINRQLAKAKVKKEILKDYEPIYQYYVLKGGKETLVDTDRILDKDGNILDKYFLVDATVTQDEVDEAKSENKVFISRKIKDYETRIRLTRKELDTIIEMSYFRSQAIHAGLLQTTDSTGKVIQAGKNNWNKHEREMMRNRPMSAAGRIIAGDYLNGMYHISEMPVDVTEDIVADIM